MNWDTLSHYSDDGESTEDDKVFEILQDGDPEEQKEALSQLESRTVKTLINVILNVMSNPVFKERILPHHQKVLKRNSHTLKKLLDKKRKIKKKRKILQKTGHRYLSTFLEIIDDDLEECRYRPRKVNRRRRDCPLCDTVDLKRLPQHLSQQHGLSKKEKRRWLRKT